MIGKRQRIRQIPCPFVAFFMGIYYNEMINMWRYKVWNTTRIESS